MHRQNEVDSWQVRGRIAVDSAKLSPNCQTRTYDRERAVARAVQRSNGTLYPAAKERSCSCRGPAARRLHGTALRYLYLPDMVPLAGRSCYMRLLKDSKEPGQTWTHAARACTQARGSVGLGRVTSIQAVVVLVASLLSGP